MFHQKRIPKAWTIMAQFTTDSEKGAVSSSSDAAKIAQKDPVDLTHLQNIVDNASEVRRLIDDHCSSIGRDPKSVELIPVSKTKPAEEIQALYDAGYRHFGENYFQELLEKAAILPNDIKWHFIGHLQSQKSARLIREVPNLHVVETLDSLKLAIKLNNACTLAERDSLSVYIQINTSGE